MRVIVMNDHGYVNGGAAQVAITSLNALAEAGVDITFVTSVGPVDLTIDSNKITVINFGLHDLQSNPSRFTAAITGIWNSRAAAQFEKILSEFDQSNTIIHLHTWSKSLTSSVVRTAMKVGFEVVCTLHDYFSICPNGGLYNYKKKEPCMLEPMSVACELSNCDSRSYSQKIWRVARQVVQRHLGGMPDNVRHFITVSDFSENLIKPHLPKGAHFYRVRNPINIERIQPADPGDRQNFTFVGRLSPEKGASLFSQAAKIAGVTACFVGSGEEEESIRKVNPKAVFLGWQDRPGVINAITRSRTLVLPSRWYETQGLVVQEAAALGVPAVVSDSCAARDSIIDKVNGFLFKSGDLDDLADKLSVLAESPELVRKLGRNAYITYWQNPSTLERHVDELLVCYESVLSGK